MTYNINKILFSKNVSLPVSEAYDSKKGYKPTFIHVFQVNMSHITKKPVFGGLQPGQTQTGLRSHRS